MVNFGKHTSSSSSNLAGIFTCNPVKKIQITPKLKVHFWGAWSPYNSKLKEIYFLFQNQTGIKLIIVQKSEKMLVFGPLF